MPIITLTSDFGLKDHHVAMMKGLIFKELKNVNIIDISHQITPFNLTEAGYIVRNAFKEFPKETINIIAVDSEYGIDNKLILIYYKNQYFLTANNGVISFIIDNLEEADIYELNHNINEGLSSIRRMIFSAIHLAKGGKPSIISKPIKQIKELVETKPKIDDNGSVITGSVIYIDNFGNVVTNITEKIFHFAKGSRKKFVINVRNNKINTIHKTYKDIESSSNQTSEYSHGKTMAIFNSEGYLEIAVYKSDMSSTGGASSLLGLKYRDNIFIKFEN
jgi:S-adenosyl-L-methionine hydrolase (adenosine-forming)